MIQPEQIAPAQRFGARPQLVGRHAADARRGEQRADARAGVRRRHDAALLERPHHADVREALHAAAAEDEGDAAMAIGGRLIQAATGVRGSK